MYCYDIIVLHVFYDAREGRKELLGEKVSLGVEEGEIDRHEEGEKV